MGQGDGSSVPFVIPGKTGTKRINKAGRETLLY
jgi:hypothetical protein